MTRRVLVHLTTTDITLALLLGSQLQAFAKSGYEVVGVSAPGPFVPEVEGLGVRHLALRHATRSAALLEDVRAFAELVRLFRDLRPDIVHTHNPKPGVYGRIAARIARVPTVVNTVHGLYALADDALPRRAVSYGSEVVASRFSDVDLVQNPEDLETLRRLRVPERKLRLLGNGIDLRRFDPTRVAPARREALRREIGAGPSDVVVGAVGRLVAEKGYRGLFAAARRVRREHPHGVFVVIGPEDPEKGDALSRSEIEAAHAEGIAFLGLRGDMEDVYAALDVYVLASHREGFPRSAMEAAAMGLPIVATDIRGCRQVVEHGRTGLLVPRDDPPALADAISTLVGGEETRRRLGGAGRAKALREFDEQRVIDITLETYAQLLKRR